MARSVATQSAVAESVETQSVETQSIETQSIETQSETVSTSASRSPLREVIEAAGMEWIETRQSQSAAPAPAPAVKLGRARKPASVATAEPLEQVETHHTGS